MSILRCPGKTLRCLCTPCRYAKDWWKQQFKTHELEHPELEKGNCVFAAAMKPGWMYIDHLIFELHGGCNVDKDSLDDIEKTGTFFSEKARKEGRNPLGTWKMLGNVLTMYWPGIDVPETAMATKSSREWINIQTRLKIDVLEPKAQNPWWFEPAIISENFRNEGAVSCKEFECPVCFFELYKFQVGVIKKHSRRVCGHYFHRQCASHLLRELNNSKYGATCPICGKKFTEVSTMPDMLHNPREWFATVDVDFGGDLSEFEVIEGLGAVLPVNRKKLEKHVRAHWHEWDPDHDGVISLQEFILPDRGMRDWVLYHMGMLQTVAQEKQGVTFQKSIPKLDENPMRWFEFWDKDSSGTLERDEVCRALIRSFCITANGLPDLDSAFDMREAFFSMWKALGYNPFSQITLDDFVKPYGLMDQIIHNQANCLYFGMDAEYVI